jgi:hypothetical protein
MENLPYDSIWVQWADGEKSEKWVVPDILGGAASHNFVKSQPKPVITPSDQDDEPRVRALLDDTRKANDDWVTWKNRELEGFLRTKKTQQLRDFADQIEHDTLKMTEAAEEEKDTAQRLVAAGAAGDTLHTELARAYRARIEILKPILAAVKEEITNRSK